jgi:hypothetical protein
MNEERTGIVRLSIFRTEAVIRGRADNTMAISKIIKRRTMGDAILHRILKIKQYEPH